MAYDGRLLRLAQERYEADRSAREADLAEQREQLYARRPRLREIQDQLRRTASRVMAAALRRGEDPLPEIQRLREENLSLQAERQMLLAELGLPDNALEDTPLCPFCNDTGYRGGEMCRCLKTYYVEEQRKELSKLLDLGSQSFDTFDTDWYSDQRAPGKTKSAREHMEWVYDTCVEYAHNFGKKPANLLLFGRPGLGKTHLSAAIAREVSGKGFSVVYDTAGHIFERFEAQKFGRDEAERDVERVLNCDLLILDDLGDGDGDHLRPERAVSDHQWPPAGKEVHHRQHQPDAGGHRTTVFRTDRLPDRGRVSASAFCGRGHPGLKKEAGPVRPLPYKHV